MPQLYTVLPGIPIADVAASHILGQVTGEARARAVVLVPTRRAAVGMRRAFQRALLGEVSLLPRILPLADINEALLTLLGTGAVTALESIPPAMSGWQQRYLLAAQIRAFLRQRLEGGEVTLDYPLTLAEDLIALEDACARAGVVLTPESLRALVSGNMANHWEQSLEFLNILATHWPGIERELGQTTGARREVLMLGALTRAWRVTAPDYVVFAVGSTASQESTAALLQVIAELPNGAVILPGVDPRIAPGEWEAMESGHPLYHLKQFLARFPAAPASLIPLGPLTDSIWQQALMPTQAIPQWQSTAPGDYHAIRLISCLHAESEARIISLLMREALETPGKRTALVTPDEGLMTRVAAQMKRYGVTIDRLDRGTLAQSPLGSLWAGLMAALREPERLIHLRGLLHHPLMETDEGLLRQLEPYWYGVRARRAGQMPKLPEAIRMHEAYPVVELLVRGMARLSQLKLPASQWRTQCEGLLAPLLAETGEAGATVTEVLEILDQADIFGPISVEEFAGLVAQQMAEPMRHGGISAHPNLVMLTPVEARLENFDRVILGSMTESVWPGLAAPNAWLNLAAQAGLGLPPPTHQVSLVAHDVLMLGSAPEVFLTWPARDQGSPTMRSRFIERLVTLLAMHGIDESAITATQYSNWGEALFAAPAFTPSAPPEPRPRREERPIRLPVSALDRLFADPFSVYAQHILRLRKLEAIDAEAQASDFGSLAHKAIQALTVHWNTLVRPADEGELSFITAHALREFSDRPSTALFWRSRLMRALRFVNGVEEERWQSPSVAVEPELPVEAALTLSADTAITLHGRIDRLESGGRGSVIGDYKTGEIPKRKEITEGYATQLLAYALLATDVGAIEYWRLPHAKHAGEIVRVEMVELEANELPQRLKAALEAMLDAKTPFISNPGRVRDYDGISRYDEWGG